MNDNYINRIIQVISVIGTAITIAQFAPLRDEVKVLIICVTAIFFIIALFLVAFSKRSFVGMYSVLSTMSLNNKLHTIREYILISKDVFQRRIRNSRPIKEGRFEYCIKPSSDSLDYYDVDYKLEFDFKKPTKISHDDAILHFYFIVERGDIKNPYMILTTSQDEKKRMKFSPKHPTMRGISEDTSDAFAGLYEASLNVLPDDKNIEIKSIIVEYSVKHHIDSSNNQYDFSIVPRNYAQKIERIEVTVKGEGIPIEMPEIWCASPQTTSCKAYQMGVEGEKYVVKLFPDMNAAYFVQISFADSKEN